MKKYKLNIAVLSLGLFLGIGTVYGKKNKRVKKGSINYLDKVSKKYRRGEISDKVLWNSLQSYATKKKSMSNEDHVRLLQTQATLLIKDRYPILASIYASKSLQASKDPFDKRVKKSWEILKSASQKAPIHNILESLAMKLKLGKKLPNSFGDDWYYFVGNALERKGKYKESIGFYNKVKITGNYYFPAKYHAAMAQVTIGDMKNAEESLKKILYNTSQSLSKLRESQRKKWPTWQKWR